MPNWCNNSIEISGPSEKIRALWAQALIDEEQNGGLLRGLRPEPEYADDEDGQIMPNWWNWRVENWGTKWEISPEGLEFIDNEDGTATLSGWFDSAWSPPVDACAFYAEANPDVRITLDYHEPGMCFVGRYTAEDGMSDDNCIDFSGYDSKTVRDAIGEDMDELWNISESMAEWEEENEDA